MKMELPIATRCTGHCCRHFSIPLDLLTDPEANVQDGDYIRDMLILLEDGPIEDDPQGRWRCTCRHFDGTGCTDYENRPAMCRDYPYGSACTWDGCTLTNRGVPS